MRQARQPSSIAVHRMTAVSLTRLHVRTSPPSHMYIKPVRQIRSVTILRMRTYLNESLDRAHGGVTPYLGVQRQITISATLLGGRPCAWTMARKRRSLVRDGGKPEGETVSSSRGRYE